MDWRHIEVLCTAGGIAGLELVNICVWNKTTPGQGSFYRSAHELIAVLRKPGAVSFNNMAFGRFGRSRTNVWTYAPPNKFKNVNDLVDGHPAPKPVAMIAEPIKDVSPPKRSAGQATALSTSRNIATLPFFVGSSSPAGMRYWKPAAGHMRN